MISLLKILKLPGSILCIKIIDDKIYILDNKFILLIYSNNTFSSIDKHILLQNQKDKHLYENTLSISKNLNFYHSYTQSSNGLIFTLKENTMHKSLDIRLHVGNISYAKFSNNAKLLLVGGEDGYSSFYSFKSKRLSFSLEARSDYISSAVFSKSDEFVCIGAYDKAIKIHNIELHENIAECKISDTPEDLIFTDDNKKVLGITRDRKLFSYLIKENSLEYASMLFAQWPTNIIQINSNYILVGTKGDVLYIFEINSLSLVKRFKVDNFGVSSLEVSENILYIGYLNGELKIIDMDHLYQEFELKLKDSKFSQANELMKKNVFLMTKDIIKIYNDTWEEVLEIAKDTLLEHNTEEADNIVNPFIWDKDKKDQYKTLQINLKDIKHFENLISQDNYIETFILADEKKYLQTLTNFQIIQTDFYKKFQVAKTLFSKDTHINIQDAKNIMDPYLKVASKKNLVHNLLLHYKIFTRSLKLIKSRNFKVYFRLVKHNEFLKEEILYSKVLEVGNQTYLKLLSFEQSQDYEKASEIATYLKDFTPFEDKVVELQHIIDSKIELIRLIKTNNTHKIYNLISQSDELKLLSSFIEYHKIFEAKRDEANDFANLGKSSEVKKIFEDHLNINYLVNSIAVIFKLSYLVELESAMESVPKNVNIPASVKRYALLFGIDSELHLLSKKLNFHNQVPKYPPNPTGFKSNNFFDCIVITKK